VSASNGAGTASSLNRRILVVSDTQVAHSDVIKLLAPGQSELGPSLDLSLARAGFFGNEDAPSDERNAFEVQSALNGEEASALMAEACARDFPYALAFVDSRLGDGWDCGKTVRKLWETDDQLQVVLLTVRSDEKLAQTMADLDGKGRLLILTKPFDPVEIGQIASVLTKKWDTASRERSLTAQVKRAEEEQSAYASSLETMNAALRKGQTVAEEASKARARFLVQMVDKVGAVLGELLDQALLKEGGASQEAVVAGSSKIMETLTRVMDLHQLDAGQWELRERSIGIGELLSRTIAPLRSLAEEKGIQLDVDAEGRESARIRCDVDRLGQVLTHLVENAVRHTLEGSVTLRASVLPTGDWNRTRLVLSVEDTGPGLAEGLSGCPFEPFVSHAGGVGLGLALVRSIARLMNASVTHEPLEGGGTAFRFSLEAALQDPVEAVLEKG